MSPRVAEYLAGLACLRRLLRKGYSPHRLAARLAGSWGELSDEERAEALAQIRERTAR